MSRPGRHARAPRIAIRGAIACALLAGTVGTADFVVHERRAARPAAGAHLPPLPAPLSRGPSTAPGPRAARSFALPHAPVPHLRLPPSPGSSPAALPVATSRSADASAGVAAPSDHAAPPALSVVRIRPGTPLASVHPRAGGTYVFKRGAVYTGTLRITASDVTIGAYGAGNDPVFSRRTEGSDIAVSGDAVRLSHIRLTGHGYQTVPGCGSARSAGYEVGIDITGENVTVDSVRAYGNLYAGVLVESSGSHATIRNSVFDGVNSLNPANFGSGAFGVLLWGDHNTVARNLFANQNTCSPSFGRDGSGVEVYHGSHNLIKYNAGRNDVDFSELGGRGAAGNVYLGNRFYAPGEFLVTRGGGDHADGPVHSTVLIGNVAHGAVVSYAWQQGDGPLLIMKDNHITRLSQDGGFVNRGGLRIGF